MTSEIADLLLLLVLRAAQRSLRNYFHVSFLELWLIFFEPVANGILAGCSLGWITWKMNPSSIMYIVPMEALEFDSECWDSSARSASSDAYPHDHIDRVTQHGMYILFHINHIPLQLSICNHKENIFSVPNCKCCCFNFKTRVAKFEVQLLWHLQRGWLNWRESLCRSCAVSLKSLIIARALWIWDPRTLSPLHRVYTQRCRLPRGTC